MSVEIPPIQPRKDAMPIDADLQKETHSVPPELLTHVEKMRVAVDNKRAKCVDGGYRAKEAVGAMAVAGGQFGVSMALLRLGHSVEEAFKFVYDFEQSRDGKYCWHSDQHEGHNGVVCGCGHCSTAIKEGEKYGVNGGDVGSLLRIVQEKTASDPERMELVVLNREHKEQGILVVTGTEYTVKPWDEEADRQYFIYDQTRHQQYLKEFAEYLKTQGKDTVYDKLWEASSAQTNATLGLLGSSKGKPMYTVNVDGEVPEIAFLMNAPVL